MIVQVVHLLLLLLHNLLQQKLITTESTKEIVAGGELQDGTYKLEEKTTLMVTVQSLKWS